MIRSNAPTPPPPPPPDPSKVQAGLKAVLDAKSATIPRKRGKAYYTPEYAAQAKILLDRLHELRVPLRIPKDAYSINTRALQYYQGAEYLRDHDTTGRYEALFRATKCTRYADYIELHIRLVPKALSDMAQAAAPWREELFAFIDNAPEGAKYHRTDVFLSEDDIKEINNTLIPLEKLFVFRATASEILVVRHTEQ